MLLTPHFVQVAGGSGDTPRSRVVGSAGGCSDYVETPSRTRLDRFGSARSPQLAKALLRGGIRQLGSGAIRPIFLTREYPDREVWDRDRLLPREDQSLHRSGSP